MSAGSSRCRATVWTQASRPELVPAAGSTSSAARSELAPVSVKAEQATSRASSATFQSKVRSEDNALQQSLNNIKYLNDEQK